MITVFIDGSHGVAGYSLKEKLQPLIQAGKILILELPEEFIKDESARYQAINQVDIAVLCLPESISAKTCEDLKDCSTIIIDASTHHRTLPGWTYGYQELNTKQLNKILNSKRIANPGCFANGMLAILNPITAYFNRHVPIQLIGVTGYSAGGKQTIQKQNENPLHFRITNLQQEHIHLKELKHWLNLTNIISFIPSVSSFENGQMVSTTIFQQQFDIPIKKIKELFQKHYSNFPEIIVKETSSSVLIPEKMSGRNDMEIYINQPSADYVQIHAMYDNLGKGSSGSIANIISKIINQKFKV